MKKLEFLLTFKISENSKFLEFDKKAILSKEKVIAKKYWEGFLKKLY